VLITLDCKIIGGDSGDACRSRVGEDGGKGEGTEKGSAKIKAKHFLYFFIKIFCIFLLRFFVFFY
jgi:hypothetical protein